MDAIQVDLLKEARAHAWDWFALHANQRMQAFNFFLVATGFLVAAYASALPKLPPVACGVALLGSWVTFWFSRLDARSRELVKAGEVALSECESQLAESTGSSAFRIVAAVERPAKWVPSYSRAFDLIQVAILAFFLAGAFYGYSEARYGNTTAETSAKATTRRHLPLSVRAANSHKRRDESRDGRSHSQQQPRDECR